MHRLILSSLCSLFILFGCATPQATQVASPTEPTAPTCNGRMIDGVCRAFCNTDNDCIKSSSTLNYVCDEGSCVPAGRSCASSCANDSDCEKYQSIVGRKLVCQVDQSLSGTNVCNKTIKLCSGS